MPWVICHRAWNKPNSIPGSISIGSRHKFKSDMGRNWFRECMRESTMFTQPVTAQRAWTWAQNLH
eukprot:5976971-Karenia_brevis.AAC.1